VRAGRPHAAIGLIAMEAPPNMGPGYTAAFRGLYPAVARATGVQLLPFLLSGVAGKADLNQGDGIHPNVRGAAIVADTVWKGLEPLLRSAASRGASAN
jgi:acyl-CoA thioesterase I